MNLLEIKKIGNLERLDEARVAINECHTLDDVVEQMNAVKREHFATTLAAVYCFDCMLANLSEETMLAEVTSVDDVKANMDRHWGVLVEAGAKTLPGGYERTINKVWALIKYLRAEKGEPPIEVAEQSCTDGEDEHTTEVEGHSYTDDELAKLTRQGASKRWAVAIFVGEEMKHLTKWQTSARTAKAEATAYVAEHGLAHGEYTAWLNNQADYNEEIELQGAQ